MASIPFEPAECFHPGEYLADVLEARGWSTRDCAERMGGDAAVDMLSLDILLACSHAPTGHAATRIRVGSQIAAGLEKALGISAQTWLNLDAAYTKCRQDKQNRSTP